jgi:hypothetical protein
MAMRMDAPMSSRLPVDLPGLREPIAGLMALRRANGAGAGLRSKNWRSKELEEFKN